MTRVLGTWLAWLQPLCLAGRLPKVRLHSHLLEGFCLAMHLDRRAGAVAFASVVFSAAGQWGRLTAVAVQGA